MNYASSTTTPPRTKYVPNNVNSQLSSSARKIINDVTFNSTTKTKNNAQPSFNVRSLSPHATSHRTNDDIHTSISLCPVTKSILDTPQLQRLRGLNQLGVANYAYVNVTHSRFEHSLGVMHLAEKLCRRIQNRQPRLGVTEKDILCVKLAGLCHDLGHGPFSHVFESVFSGDSEWKHEDVSLMMIDAALKHLGLAIDETRLDDPLKQISDGVNAVMFGVCNGNDAVPLDNDNVLTSRDWIFIKECILGGPLRGRDVFIGRPEVEKEFLYDVVCNRHSGLDVDKIDYYARDKRRALGGSGEVDVIFVEEAFAAWGRCPKPHKCFRCAKATVISPRGGKNEHLMIAYPEKLVFKAMEFFKTRFSLHSKVYTHKTTQAATYMIKDILTLADPYIEIPVDDKVDGRTLKISESMHDPDAYVNLQDSIIDTIFLTRKKGLESAKKIIRRLKSRELYKCVLNHPIRRNDQKDNRIWDEKTERDIEDELLKTIIDAKGTKGTKIYKGCVKVQKRTIHHGRMADNPVNLMRFLPKRELYLLDRDPRDLPLAHQVDEELYASHIPRLFLEKSIRVFCTVMDEDVRELVKLAFDTWIHTIPEMTGLTPTKNEAVMLSQDGSEFGYGGIETNNMEMTPLRCGFGGTKGEVTKRRRDNDDNYDGDDDDYMSDYNGRKNRKQSRVVRNILEGGPLT